ncbi:6039_t:CDS:2 [Scutellospora calospora]|uniref:6039_t:CDS:1 n=1 Tax=Scutellospora calospora TaxID=85575 RepID=A0ACA9K234_9GLOM|nr:6039_t:CDS:2 [Scutellospora calospora]
MSYVRGRPPLKEIWLNFTKVAEPDKHGQKTPHQKCNYCEEDCVYSVDQLKDKLDVDSILARFFYSVCILFTAVENPFWEEFMEAIQYYIKTVYPFYISPN